MQRQVRFNRVPEHIPEKVPGVFGAEPCQVQQGSGEGSGESLGVFGAEPGQIQQGQVPEKVLGGFGAKKLPEKVWKALVLPGQVQ